MFTDTPVPKLLSVYNTIFKNGNYFVHLMNHILQRYPNLVKIMYLHANCWSISLINVDIKNLTAILANILQQVINSVVKNDQVGFNKIRQKSEVE